MTLATGALTAPLTIELMTVRTLRRALSHVGWLWTPVPWVASASTRGHLYTWVAGPASQLEDRGSLYIGIDESTRGDRLSREYAMATEEYVHGHALAVLRNGAKAASGLLAQREVDLRWALGLRSPDCVARLFDEWIALRAGLRPLRLAEQFAVRCSLHLGDTGAPVNSQYKGAWASTSSEASTVNRLAELIAEHLRTDVFCIACSSGIAMA